MGHHHTNNKERGNVYLGLSFLFCLSKTRVCCWIDNEGGGFAAAVGCFCLSSAAAAVVVCICVQYTVLHVVQCSLLI